MCGFGGGVGEADAGDAGAMINVVRVAIVPLIDQLSMCNCSLVTRFVGLCRCSTIGEDRHQWRFSYSDLATIES